jgi:thiol-disulfide isomerase/thioredoxin
MRIFLLAALAVALAACHRSPDAQPSSKQATASAGEGIKGVHRDNKGHPAPLAQFDDAEGKPTSLSTFLGKPLLLNLWATWCAPCVKELPTLDRLAKSGSFSVVAVSEDSAPHASVVAFLKAHHISGLRPYQDPKMALSGALGPDTVLPTSILISADGKEVWRYVGDLDWTSPEAARLLAEAGAAPKHS